MSVFKFSVKSENGDRYNYYCMSKDIKSYIRTHRHQWGKMDKSQIVKPNIHSIIGGHFGEWDYCEFPCITDCYYDENDRYTEKKICGKDLLKRFVNSDPHAINVNKLHFNKRQYNREYSRNRNKYKTIEELVDSVL